MRNEGELPKLVVTTAANHNGVRESNRTAVSAGLGSSTLAAILGALAEQLCLLRKDVIQDAIDAPALEPMVRDHTGPLEMIAQRAAQGAVDARPPSHLGLLQQLQTSIEGELAQPVVGGPHVPSTSTLPASVTRTLTKSSDGKE